MLFFTRYSMFHSIYQLISALSTWWLLYILVFFELLFLFIFFSPLFNHFNQYCYTLWAQNTQISFLSLSQFDFYPFIIGRRVTFARLWNKQTYTVFYVDIVIKFCAGICQYFHLKFWPHAK